MHAMRHGDARATHGDRHAQVDFPLPVPRTSSRRVRGVCACGMRPAVRAARGGNACRNVRRDASLICAVEEASDIGAIERAGEFRGVYHVLGGRLSPLDGVGPDDLTIPQLENRVSGGLVREVILATNPSIEGEATALYVQRKLLPYQLTVTRIARGLPVGGDLEYADGVTIAQALSARRAM